jgi:hypothetical protein
VAAYVQTASARRRKEEEAMGKPKKTSGKKAPNDLAVKDGKTVKGGAFCAKGSHIPKVTLHLYR